MKRERKDKIRHILEKYISIQKGGRGKKRHGDLKREREKEQKFRYIQERKEKEKKTD